MRSPQFLKSTLSSLLLMCSLGAAAADGPGRVTVRAVRSSGQGCPIGSARADISADAQTFSLLMDEYVAQADRTKPTARRDCDIEVDLDIPSGWTYALISADYRGFVDVPNGATASQRVIYAFEQTRGMPGYRGDRGFAFKATEFRGPQSGDYTIHNEIEATTAPRSLCSRGGTQTLYMNTLLMARMMSARGANDTSMIALDSLDGQVASQNYRFAWFQCDNFQAPDPRPNPRPDPRPRPRPPERPSQPGRGR